MTLDGTSGTEQVTVRAGLLTAAGLALAVAPALTWEDAAGKARYLLSIFATTPAAQDPRRQRLIANLLADFIRLSAKNE
jgi:hypothetical protein